MKAVNATAVGPHGNEDVDRRQPSAEHLVRQFAPDGGHGGRHIQAIVVVHRCFRPKQVKGRKLFEEQPGRLKASSHATLLDQTEPAIHHTVVSRSDNPRVPISNGQAVAEFRECLVPELGAVSRTEAPHVTTDVGQACPRSRVHIGRALALEWGCRLPMRVAADVTFCCNWAIISIWRLF